VFAEIERMLGHILVSCADFVSLLFCLLFSDFGGIRVSGAERSALVVLLDEFLGYWRAFAESFDAALQFSLAIGRNWVLFTADVLGLAEGDERKQKANQGFHVRFGRLTCASLQFSRS
jgi:hypothetical protein